MGIELINGNCMDYMRNQPDNAFDLAIVDPPYGIGIAKSAGHRLKRYNKTPKNWDDATPDQTYFDELFRVSKNQIIWGGNYFYLPPTQCFLIWDKSQPENFSFASCEYAWTSFQGVAKTYYQRPMNADIERIHTTQKPVKLYQWILDKFAKPEQKILDTHLGSASSAIAAHYFGVDFVGIELDQAYYAAAKKRFNQATSQTSLF